MIINKKDMGEILKKRKVIAFMGADGSGKSTMAKKLAEYFGGRCVYYGMFNDNTKLVRLLINKSKVAGSTISKKGYSLKNLIAPFIYTIDFIIRYYRDIKPKDKLDIVVTDRYAYDLILLKAPMKLKKLLMKLFPRPYLIYLYNDIDVMIKRDGIKGKEYYQYYLPLFDEIDYDLRIKTDDIEEDFKKIKNEFEKV